MKTIIVPAKSTILKINSKINIIESLLNVVSLEKKYFTKKNLLKIAISLILITILIQFIDLNKVFLILFNFQTIYFFPVLLFFFLVFIVNTINLWVLFSPIRKFNFLYLLLQHIKSWSAGFLVPGKIGELSLSYLLRKEVKIGKSTAIIVIDKIVSLAVISFISVLSFILFFGFYQAMELIAILGMGTALLFFFIFTETGRELIKKVILKKYSKIFSGFSKTLSKYFTERKSLISINFGLTMSRLIIQTSMIYSIFAGLGSFVGFASLLMVICMTTIVSMIPIAIGGLGLREGSFVLLCTMIGIPIDLSAATALISAAIRYSTVFLVGAIVLWKGDMFGKSNNSWLRWT